MAAKDKHPYPDFDGWTVTHHPRRNELRAVKEHSAARNGRLVVRVYCANLDRGYLLLRRDALIEEARVTPNDVDLAARVHDAEKALVADKVKNGLAKGLGKAYAFERLSNAGFTVAEMAPFLDGEK